MGDRECSTGLGRMDGCSKLECSEDVVEVYKIWLSHAKVFGMVLSLLCCPNFIFGIPLCFFLA